MDRERDLTDLRRNSAIWLFAEIWIGAGYVLQEPAKDPYDAAERYAFTLAMAIIIPLISAGFLIAWWPLLASRRREGRIPAPR